jgi:hypothetical protein
MTSSPDLFRCSAGCTTSGRATSFQRSFHRWPCNIISSLAVHQQRLFITGGTISSDVIIHYNTAQRT